MTKGSRQGVGGEGGQGTGEHYSNDEWLMTEERRGAVGGLETRGWRGRWTGKQRGGRCSLSMAIAGRKYGPEGAVKGQGVIDWEVGNGRSRGDGRVMTNGACKLWRAGNKINRDPKLRALYEQELKPGESVFHKAKKEFFEKRRKEENK